MAEHTPGPWHADVEGPFALGGDSIEVEAVTDDGMLVRRSIATLMIDTEENDDTPEAEEDKANACLIAAAPDLLAVCRDLFVWAQVLESQTHHTECDRLYESIEKAEAAIARATGRSLPPAPPEEPEERPHR